MRKLQADAGASASPAVLLTEAATRKTTRWSPPPDRPRQPWSRPLFEGPILRTGAFAAPSGWHRRPHDHPDRISVSFLVPRCCCSAAGSAVREVDLSDADIDSTTSASATGGRGSEPPAVACLRRRELGTARGAASKHCHPTSSAGWPRPCPQLNSCTRLRSSSSKYGLRQRDDRRHATAPTRRASDSRTQLRTSVVVHGGGRPEPPLHAAATSHRGDPKGGFGSPARSARRGGWCCSIQKEWAEELIPAINAHGPYAVGSPARNCCSPPHCGLRVTVDGVATDIGGRRRRPGNTAAGSGRRTGNCPRWPSGVVLASTPTPPPRHDRQPGASC